MPATATLTNNASTVAFTLPAGTKGVIIWNKSAAELRVRFGAVAAASGANEGMPIAAGDETIQYVTRFFEAPLRKAVKVHIFQASGGNITSGVGYDPLND